jgi:type IV pilus assembly protein PilV
MKSRFRVRGLRPHALRSQRRAGFALLEALIAIVLFSIGLLGMVALQARATQMSIGSEDRTRAAALANDMVALMWNTNASSVSSADLAAWQGRVSDSSNLGVPGGVGSVAIPTGCNVIIVQVAWKAINKATAATSSAASSCDVALPANTNSAYKTKFVIP